MLTTPMTVHQLHLLGVGLVQRGVVVYQKPVLWLDQRLGFGPQRLRVGRLSREQAGEGIVSRWGFGARRLWLGASCLGAGENLLGGDQELNVVQFVTSGWVHRSFASFNR